MANLYSLFVCLVSFVLLPVFRRLLRTSEQKRRDEYALALFTAVRSGEVAKFAVFLRPFYITGNITFEVSGGPQGAPTRFDIEEILINALAMPVLALGNPGEAYGVGRILENEDSWKSAVSNLMRQASLILCMPSGRPGLNGN